MPYPSQDLSNVSILNGGDTVYLLSHSHISNSHTLIAQTPQLTEQHRENRESSGEIAIMGLGLLLLIGMLCLVFRKKRSSEIVATIPPQQEDNHMRSLAIPCRHCYYFHPNLHLQCAVRPDSVLKRQASQCTDYRSRNGQEDIAA